MHAPPMTTSAPTHMAGLPRPGAGRDRRRDLPVDGALPPELTGRYLRNGPNPLPGEPSRTGSSGTAWCTAYGCATGAPSGTATAGCARQALRGESLIKPDGTSTAPVGVANTHVIAHAGRIMRWSRAASRTSSTPELATVGPCDFDGRLTTAMTAHPKTDPRDRRAALLRLRVRAAVPHLPPALARRASSSRAREIAVPGADDDARLRHHRPARRLPRPADDVLPGAAPRGMPYGWDDAYGARIGVMPLTGRAR